MCGGRRKISRQQYNSICVFYANVFPSFLWHGGRRALLKERNFQYYSQIGGKVVGILLNDVESFYDSSWNFQRNLHTSYILFG